MEFTALRKDRSRRETLKDCPDLAAMSPSQRAEFWSQTDPRELRRLGDRLLAESLPLRAGPNYRERLADAALAAREATGWSRETTAKLLGVTESLIEAWEDDQVKTPDSLPLVIKRLAELGASAE